MKKTILLVTSLLCSVSLVFNQRSLCDSVALATIPLDVVFAREMQLADSAHNHFLFERFQSVSNTTPSRTTSQLVVSGEPVTFIDAVGTFPDFVDRYDYHLWDRADIDCPILIQGENGVVIRLRYKTW